MHLFCHSPDPVMADPTPTDRSIAQRIQLVPSDERRRFAVSLPAPLTSFVGRGRDVKQVCDLLRCEAIRLITLTGPGGVGKTRLAVRVASHLAPEFLEGVVFVSLASLADPDFVLPTIAQALGAQEAGDRPLVERLGA